MEFLRRAANPWGQEVLLGIAWDLMWAAVIAGVVFVVAHAVYVWRTGVENAPDVDSGSAEKVVRHSGSSRAFHWLMSIAMFALLITAFFPVIGIRFPWVTIHWIAGLGLIATIVYHIVHSVFWQDLRSMWFGRAEVRESITEFKRFFSRSNGSGDEKPGKYPLDHKLYHHTIAVVSLAAIVTGVLMMVRVDTPFWTRNPYLLSDNMWGIVYVVHGLSGVALITMVMAHVYFAIRPEKWWITRSMILGWVYRKEYLAHHDPSKWSPPAQRSPTPVSGGSGGLPEGVPRDPANRD